MFDQGKSGDRFRLPPPRRTPERPRSFYAERLARAASLITRLALRAGADTYTTLRKFVFSLSGQLFILTAIFILLVETVILIPSLAADQERWLTDSIRKAEIASQAIDASPKNAVRPELAPQLLNSAGVKYLAIQNNGVRNYRLYDPSIVVPDKILDMREAHKTIFSDIVYLAAPWQTLMSAHAPLLHLVATPHVRSGQVIEIVVPSAPLKAYLKTSLLGMLRVSLSISFAAGILVFAALSAFIVRPIQNLTRAIVRFKTNPEDPQAVTHPGRRQDEIGQIERELAAMQDEVRHALRSRARLAALGQAVSKINHDLRNMLTSAQMASDRLSAAAASDPAVAKALPRLERALDRALSLAQNVLTYGKSDEHAPQIQIVRLKELAEAAAEDAGLGLTTQAPEPVRFMLKASKGFHLEADPEQLHRLLVNLMRNARQAIEMQPNRRARGRVTLTAVKTMDEVILMVADNGPGIPEKLRDKLFQPFTGTNTPGGTGLGLAIARELAQIHGGDVRLAMTGPEGTTFEIKLPVKG